MDKRQPLTTLHSRSGASLQTLATFEFTGTFFLTIVYRLLFEVTQSLITFFFAFWMLTLLTIRVSGAHNNPVLTLIEVFSPKDSLGFRLSKQTGAIYIAAQTVGAFCGALIAWFLTKSGGSLTVFEGRKYVTQALTIEIIGTFLMSTVYLIIQDQNVQIASIAEKLGEQNDGSPKGRKVQHMALYWSAAFTTSLYMTQKLTGGSLNPAVALGINCTMAFHGDDHAFQYIYIYLFCPLVGCFLALVFYQFVYSKTKAQDEVLYMQAAQVQGLDSRPREPKRPVEVAIAGSVDSYKPKRSSEPPADTSSELLLSDKGSETTEHLDH